MSEYTYSTPNYPKKGVKLFVWMHRLKKKKERKKKTHAN